MLNRTLDQIQKLAKLGLKKGRMYIGVLVERGLLLKQNRFIHYIPIPHA